MKQVVKPKTRIQQMIDILTFSKQTENEKVTYTKIGMAPAQG